VIGQIFAIVVLGAGIIINMKAQSMSDEKRKELGLGPKGQGRR
jgi:hypothetical protein